MTARSMHMAVILAALLSGTLALPVPAQQPEGEDPVDLEEVQVGLDELFTPPPPAPPSIQANRLPAQPAPGKGRLTVQFEGNRRWCTFPDDRVVKPPAGLTSRGAQPNRNAVYTFGYQFTIAAVERARPAETLLLFESPVFRTAVFRQAAKVGQGKAKPQGGPKVTEIPETIAVKPFQVDPTSLIPWWQEQYRCTTLPEAIDIDIDPGIYDVYAAFDILLRSGSWTHRSIGFGTDIVVEGGRVTRVDARANMSAGARRDLEILGATLVEPAAPAESR